MEEQIDLFDAIDKNEIKVLCKLERDFEHPLKSMVELDKFTQKAQDNFDYDFNGESNFFPYKFPKELENLDFSILAIIGSSGSGKSTFSRYFGKEEQLSYDNNKAIISHFENEDEAVEKLCAVGLNSIPTWCKPRNVLSVGEGFRCDLARKIKNNCVIDEFTSTIDRNVAISCSVSISKYIRKNNLKKCVFVSCHKDFIEYLRPDYVVDIDNGCVYDTRGLPKRKIELQIYERFDKHDLWNIFKQHHYLSEDLNVASRIYVAIWKNQIVGMIAILPQPNGYCLNGYRIHRLVVLPDYQGLGVGMALINFIVDHYNNQDKIIYIRTTHYKLCKALANSKDWKQTARSGEQSPTQPNMTWKITNRKPMSFESVKKVIEKKKSIMTKFTQLKI